MFALSRRPDARIAPARGHELSISYLGPGVRIRGALEIEGELTVAGIVAGRIAALRIIIAPQGFVEGDIVAREAVIAGRLNGRVFAPNVIIEESADITGRIFHTNVTTARGARIDPEARMPWRPASYFETLDQLPEAQP